jgi:hypothetical protein
MITERLFIEHPRSIGETYLEHQQHALSFGVELVLAGIACIVHALVPAIFVTTGSRTVTRLYGRMVTNRASARRSMSADQGAAVPAHSAAKGA